MTAPPADLAEALRGRYTLERELGRGGMATVYLARDMKHRRDVAIKVLRPELAATLGAGRFLREIEIAAQLNHPHILALHDSGDAGGFLFYVMPYLSGDSLRQKLHRERQLSIDEALAIIRQIASALDYAHARTVIHRDIKPENILFHEGEAVVADFGIALALSAVGERLTDAGAWVGTPEYMSPEQLMGEWELDARSDVYSLACVLYELLAGEAPYLGLSAQAVVAKKLLDPVPALSRLRTAVPAGIEQALVKALAKDPADRFASAGDFARALSQPARGLARPPSVAVLPFLNLSADPDNEYFADGITEDVIAQLSKIHTLKVISRASVMPYKKREQSLREIGMRLGIQALLDGSVRRAGNRVRIVAQLIDVASEEHLWGETYDRELTDIFAIQSDVALQIAGALHAQLTRDERTRIAREPTKNLEAYQLYLRGRHCFLRFTEEGIGKALDHLEQAIQKDPGYALAYASTALGYVALGIGHGAGALRPAQAYHRAKEAVTRALELDPTLGEAHTMLAFVKTVYDFDWTGAEAEFKRALELNPNSPDTHDFYGLMLSAVRRYDEAIALQIRARELDPLTSYHFSDLASTLLRAGKYLEAAHEAERVIELEPGFPMGHSTLGWAHMMLDRRELGLAELEKAVALSPGNTLFLAQLAQAYAIVGNRTKARELLTQLEALASERYVSPYHLAYVYTGLGDAERAIDCLERAVEERSGGVYGVKGSFLFSSLHGHPRFRALLRTMGLI